MNRIFDLFANKTFGAMRSDAWPKVRKEHIKEHPECAVCGKKGNILKPNEAHHIQSFATHPELELSSQNLITGCREHHQWFYHLGDFKSLNENAREDASVWYKKIHHRPKWNGTEWVYPPK